MKLYSLLTIILNSHIIYVQHQLLSSWSHRVFIIIPIIPCVSEPVSARTMKTPLYSQFPYTDSIYLIISLQNFIFSRQYMIQEISSWKKTTPRSEVTISCMVRANIRIWWSVGITIWVHQLHTHTVCSLPAAKNGPSNVKRHASTAQIPNMIIAKNLSIFGLTSSCIRCKTPHEMIVTTATENPQAAWPVYVLK